jgi:hypothetical protein
VFFIQVVVVDLHRVAELVVQVATEGVVLDHRHLRQILEQAVQQIPEAVVAQVVMALVE